MKFRHIPGLQASDENEGIIYLAQLLDEMLFDYTLDTYKPSMHSSSSLIREALSVLSLVERDNLDKQHLVAVLEEFKSVAERDEIVPFLTSLDFRRMVDEVSSDKPREARAVLTVLSRALGARRYFGAVRRELKAIASDKKKKKDIRALARSYATSLTRLGYTRRFIRHRLDRSFFGYQNTDKSSSERLQEFDESFDLSRKHYVVYFGVSSDFEKISGTCVGFKSELVTTCPTEITGDIKARLDWNSYTLFLRKEVNALEHFGAARLGEMFVEKIANLYSLFHHKTPLTWSKCTWIWHKENDRQWYVDCSRSPIKRVLDAKPIKAGELLHQLVSKFSMEDAAFDQFDRLVDLHGAAVRSDTAPAQLLNLWSALESLVPSSVSRGSKIAAVSSTLIPVLLLNYPRSLFEDALADLIRWDWRRTKAFLKQIKNVPDDKRTDQLTCLLISPDYEDLRKDLLNQLGSYVLLRNRMHALHDRFSRPGKLLDVLARHEERLGWQLRRIYRTRNMYVHSGTKTKLMDSLVENAHYYLDTYMKKLVTFVGEEPPVTTFEEAYVVARERVMEWRGLLKGTNEWSAAMIPRIVLGL